MRKKLNFKAVIFDMDGVITNTAKVHGKAWKRMFDSFLERYADLNNTHFSPFDEYHDYLNYVDGKPRLEGIKSFLHSRNIKLPLGTETDTIDKNTVYALGNWKNSFFTDTVLKDGPEVFETSVNLIKKLLAHGVKTGIATSSKNADLILKLAKIENLFQTKVDGVYSEKNNLKGKPSPDIFVEAAGLLGFRPSECIMVEDAISGVESGRNGNFGFVIAIARTISGDELSINGADVVVRDLGEITIEEMNNWFTNGMIRNGWYLKYQGFKPENERLRETLCTVGNGYMACRGAIESSKASDISYPATYMSGLYNKLATKIQNKNIYNNDLVNIPNWTLIKFRINNGKYIEPSKEEILSYQQGLDLKRALMKRRIIIKDKTGRITKINSIRILSMDNPHIAAIKYQITPLNYKANITLKSSIDADIINDGVVRYRELNQRHIKFKSSGKFKHGIFLTAQTTGSKVDICFAMKNIVYGKSEKLEAKRVLVKEKAKIAEDIRFYARDTQSYMLEKIVSIHKSTDSKSPLSKAKEDIKDVKFEKIYRAHLKAWDRGWNKIDIKINGDRFAQKILRLHMFHLIASYSNNNEKIDSSIGARGLHGEAYRGHIFWDELFIQPFYNLHCPHVTKSMLMYRFRRLKAARDYAKKFGYKGAMYPWQTADDGGEETQIIHYNPVSGDWKPDLSSRQRHVNIAIFYNIIKYFEYSDDIKFITNYGAEMLLDIAKFWSSISVLEKDGRYHIEGVMGPDEFHEKFPGSKKEGLKDNAYTNIMVVWLLKKTLDIIQILPKPKLKSLSKKIGITNKEILRWWDIQKRIYVPISPEGIIEQFHGYMSLKELDFKALRLKYGNIKRVDRLLKAEKDSPDNYKISKQADTLMLFYLLDSKELKSLLSGLGYEFEDELTMLRKHYDYYEPRTTHDSTLSMVVHAIISKQFCDKELVWSWFMEALNSDINDSQGGTTEEGIHAGVMAGTIDIFYRNFAGISFDNNILNINPSFPEHWKDIAFKIQYKNVWYIIYISHTKIVVKIENGMKSQKINILGKTYTVLKNKTKEVRY